MTDDQPVATGKAQNNGVFLERRSARSSDQGSPVTTDHTPNCLYDPARCPCPRGEQAGCPRYRRCEACIAFHRTPGNPPQTACERKTSLSPAH